MGLCRTVADMQFRTFGAVERYYCCCFDSLIFDLISGQMYVMAISEIISYHKNRKCCFKHFRWHNRFRLNLLTFLSIVNNRMLESLFASNRCRTSLKKRSTGLCLNVCNRMSQLKRCPFQTCLGSLTSSTLQLFLYKLTNFL